MGSDPALQYYQAAADWLRDLVLRQNGEQMVKMVYHPPFWFAYNAIGECIFRVEDELMERVHALASNDDTAVSKWEFDEILSAVLSPSATRVTLEADDPDDNWDDDYNDEGGC